MYFPKTTGSSNSIQFGGPKTPNTLNNPEGGKMTFTKYPALSKNNLNLSSDQPMKKSFGSFIPTRISSPTQQSQTFKRQGLTHTRHTTDFTDSLQASKTMTDNSNVAILQLEFQISSLKSENKRLKQQFQRKIATLGGEKQLQFGQLTVKLQTLNQQIIKQKVTIEELTSNNKTLTSENDSLISKINNNKTTIDNLNKKIEQSSHLIESFKEELKQSKIQQSSLQNTINKLEAQVSQVNINFKNSQERLVDIKAKQDGYKTLIYTMSQQKTLLNNRISQLIEQQAKLHNAEVMSKSEQNTVALEKSNHELTQQVTHLKKKINDILNQQQSSSLKVLYENKIMIMERQIQQLKHRYQSPDTKAISHDHNQQQWKSLADDKNRQINQLKGIVTNLQTKITHLNKQLLNNHSNVSSSKIPLSYETQTQLNNLRIEIKALKKVNQTLDQKLKYLINESKKKDQFLKEYISANINKGQQFIFVQKFFKKYEIQIPADGFLKVSMKNFKTIQELEQRVKYLSNKLYS